MGEATLKRHSNVPNLLFLFEKYFQRKIRRKKALRYTKIYISHSKPMTVIKGDLIWWLKEEQRDIYVKEI